MASKKLPLTEAVHQDIHIALTTLQNLCTKHKVYLAGFIFGADPMVLYNFGNTKSASQIETYEKCCKLADKQRTAGRVREFKPSKPN